MSAVHLIVVVTLLLGGSRLLAEGTTPAAGANRMLTADEIKLLAGLLRPEWQTSLELKTGLGWNSNVLLAGTAREASGFARADLETFFWFQPQGTPPVEVTGFLNASRRDFFSAGDSPENNEVFAQTEARWRPVPALRLSLRAQGYYLDSVLDLSTESDRLAARLKTTGCIWGGGLRWDLGRGFALEATGALTRSHFWDIPEDYGETRAGGRLAWQSADGRVVLGAGAFQRNRRYDERNRTTPAGRPLSGTRLRYRQPEGELSAALKAKWRGDWQATAVLNGSRNSDNGGGYFDYHQVGVRCNLDWVEGPWEGGLALAASRYRWDVQTVGIGLDPPHRARRDRSCSLELKRELAPHWLAFVEAEREWIDSNDVTTSYSVTKFSAGVGWKL